MLQIEHLHAGYGAGTVLHDLTLHAPPGTVHAVVGHNGAGKTTLVHAIAGLIRARQGRIRLDGRDITTMPVHRRVRAGIALVPQGRRVFASLTVAEHLAIAGQGHQSGPGQPWDRQRVLALLPQLGDRLRHRGAQLSGGEQQMLAIARALLTQPRLLLLDEPTEGLAPTLVQQVRELIGKLASSDLTIVLTAPQPEFGATADHITTLANGRTVPPPEPARSPDSAEATATTTGRPAPGRR